MSADGACVGTIVLDIGGLDVAGGIAAAGPNIVGADVARSGALVEGTCVGISEIYTGASDVVGNGVGTCVVDGVAVTVPGDGVSRSGAAVREASVGASESISG